jgi:hypothetical protein
MTNRNFKIHPLAELFPMMPPDEFEKLKKDIQKNGQLEPIMLNDEGLVLDGRNRLRACNELGIEVRAKNFEVAMRGGPPITEADYIWSANVLRRHLTDDQRASLSLKWADGIRVAAKQRMKDGGKGLVDSPNPIHTREAVAKKAGVSANKIRQAETVAKRAPELLPKIESGAMKLKDAVKTISKKTKRFNMDMVVTKIISDMSKRMRAAVPSQHLPEFKKELRDAIDVWLRNL